MLKLSYLRLLILCFFSQLFATTPKLTIVFVIDQMAYNHLTNLLPNLKYTIKELYEDGIVYSNAFQPNGAPSTAVGHTDISTGAYPKDHGIIGNKWFINGKSFACDTDNSGTAQILTLDGTEPKHHGKSAKNIMVDTLSDQVMLQPNEKLNWSVYAVSLKSRSAIGLAGKLGKAIWFEPGLNIFTSSKAYFKQMPDWLKTFNQKNNVNALEKFTWKTMYDENSSFYKFRNIKNYEHTKFGMQLVNREIIINKTDSNPFGQFLCTPMANELQLNLAQDILKLHDSKNSHVLLWIALSGLDKVGHRYGPESIEAIDFLYQLDKQLKDFLSTVYTKWPQEEVLIAMTADHGVHPILENVKKAGYETARRIDAKKLIALMDEYAKKEFGIEKIVMNFKTPYFFLNHEEIGKLKKSAQLKLLRNLKKIIADQPGIKKVWTFNELKGTHFFEDDLAKLFKNQLFKGRSGDLIYQVYPYNYVDDKKSGTSHLTPYAYDRQVPIIIYQPNQFENKLITKNTSILQLPVTLAAILNVPRPSASTASILPGINIKKVKRTGAGGN